MPKLLHYAYISHLVHLRGDVSQQQVKEKWYAKIMLYFSILLLCIFSHLYAFISCATYTKSFKIQSLIFNF